MSLCPVRHSTLSGPGLFAVMTAMALLACKGVKASPEEEVSLTWRNGDELTGQILPDGAGETIRFEARPFSTPLDLRLGQLSGIRFPSAIAKSDPISEPSFEVSLRNGDRLQGKLLALDADGITLDCSPYLGTVVIRREAIARLGTSSG